jgi:hypothetical protein
MHPKQEELRLDAIGFELLQEENPVEASRYGRNTVFHYCETEDRRASYAGCLHTLEAVFDGRGHLVPTCEAAINSGTCEAVNKRKLELKEGRALFYVDYVELAKRRQEEIAKQDDDTPRFGRRSKPGKFIPTQVKLLDEPTSEPKRVEPKQAPIAPQVNIMEQVLKKRLENEHSINND